MLQNYQSVTVAYIDFANFDSVSHKKLICRLEHYGIDGCLLSWIKNYLSGRTQVTRVNGKLSVSKHLTSSIVQGSGIGPMMFVTYINELAEILVDYNVGVKLFADELKIYATLSSSIEAANLQSALSRVYKRATMWQLSVSTTKCCILHIGKPPSNVTFSVDGVDLPNHSTVRDLGVFVNDSLSPQSRISKVTVTANQRVNLLMRAFVSRDQSTLVRAYVHMLDIFLNTILSSGHHLTWVTFVEWNQFNATSVNAYPV